MSDGGRSDTSRAPFPLPRPRGRDRRRSRRRLNGVRRGAPGVWVDLEPPSPHLRQAVLETPEADPALLGEVRGLEQRLNAILMSLRGDPTLRRHGEPSPPSISQRVNGIVFNHWNVTSPPTGTQRDAYRYAAEAFGEVLEDLRTLVEDDIAQLEAKLEAAGAAWTPGRIPDWEIVR